MTTRETLLEQRRKIDARLRRLDARDKAQARKADTRRKIIAGALALEHAQQDPAFGETLRGLLAKYVERPQDRALFGLPPKEDAPGALSSGGDTTGGQPVPG